ncbi:SDR family oxidoreductase, partial [Mycobacterium asiaticum]|uniref:SDR family oxidoreductase n=1 Tax=Mycobacterium asiaticum TaxID=1790 RepID=UPI000B23D88B
RSASSAAHVRPNERIAALLAAYTVNTVVPGPVETPGLKGLAPAGSEQELLDAEAAKVPMRRLGRPSEIAAAVLFLASDESSFMTGAELFVDGGVEQV